MSQMDTLWSYTLKGELKGLGIGWRIMLVVNTWAVSVWIEFSCLRIGTGGWILYPAFGKIASCR